jgi:hypothetical protein
VVIRPIIGSDCVDPVAFSGAPGGDYLRANALPVGLVGGGDRGLDPVRGVLGRGVLGRVLRRLAGGSG